jgi:hypothetical protein
VRGWSPITRGALLLTIAGAAAGCGRLGFDASDPAGDDGGGGGGSDGGGGSGEDGGDPDAGVVSLCGETNSLLVTTDVDEGDLGEQPVPPHLGTGLSLREALALSNQRAGRDCIRFVRPMTILIAAPVLDAIADETGVDIDGGGEVHVTGVPGGPRLAVGIDLAAGQSAVRNLRVSNFGVGIRAATDGNSVGPGAHVHGCAAGVLLGTSHNTITGLRSHDNDEHGIQVATGAGDIRVSQVILQHNAIDGIQASGTSLLVRHATIALNGVGITGGGEAAITVANSIFYRNAGAGLTAEDSAEVDFADFFEDTCNNCAVGDNTIDGDPLFVDVEEDDYRLGEGSPAINAGSDTGLDVNGDQPGSFNGAAPDLGALESDE